ncbi:MAG: hypothetical protein OXM62_04200, partial [bacterium]|nr:hypothetical protein [bacterium]
AADAVLGVMVIGGGAADAVLGVMVIGGAAADAVLGVMVIGGGAADATAVRTAGVGNPAARTVTAGVAAGAATGGRRAPSGTISTTRGRPPEADADRPARSYSYPR